ncbi:hypothetical protein LCGC14_1258330 [marine sediment metagenome]|uniref:Uncharacterized protein n=1 Tax=marine sediment metagenome TaxID=412755 RepID=A0A0F9L1E8_9ZZZZ
MTFVRLSEYECVALAADVKTIAGTVIGAHCLEYDTGEEWYFDGTAWREIDRVVVQIEHKQVHNGRMWDISGLFISIANDAVADLVLEVGSDELYIDFSEASSGAGYAAIYEGPTVTAETGTAAFVKNSNRTTGDSGAITALKNPTITGLGTQLIEWFSAGGTGGNSDGGTAGRESGMLLKINTKYLFRLTNKKGNAADISWLIHAYEHF